MGATATAAKTARCCRRLTLLAAANATPACHRHAQAGGRSAAPPAPAGGGQAGGHRAAGRPRAYSAAAYIEPASAVPGRTLTVAGKPARAASSTARHAVMPCHRAAAARAGAAASPAPALTADMLARARRAAQQTGPVVKGVMACHRGAAGQAAASAGRRDRSAAAAPARPKLSAARGATAVSRAATLARLVPSDGTIMPCLRASRGRADGAAAASAARPAPAAPAPQLGQALSQLALLELANACGRQATVLARVSQWVHADAAAGGDDRCPVPSGSAALMAAREARRAARRRQQLLG